MTIKGLPLSELFALVVPASIAAYCVQPHLNSRLSALAASLLGALLGLESAVAYRWLHEWLWWPHPEPGRLFFMGAFTGFGMPIVLYLRRRAVLGPADQDTTEPGDPK